MVFFLKEGWYLFFFLLYFLVLTEDHVLITTPLGFCFKGCASVCKHNTNAAHVHFGGTELFKGKALQYKNEFVRLCDYEHSSTVSVHRATQHAFCTIHCVAVIRSYREQIKPQSGSVFSWINMFKITIKLPIEQGLVSPF